MTARSGALSALQRVARRWAYRRQGRDPVPVTLRRGRIYILPTRAGWALALLLLAMLLAALNYANSMSFALTFTLASVALVSMYHAHANLLGLQVAPGRTAQGFQGETAALAVQLRNGARFRRRDILLTDRAGQTRDVTDIDPGEEGRLQLDVTPRDRGPYRVMRFGLATTWPFGLFRAWCWLEMPLEGLAWPRPVPDRPAPARDPDSDDGGRPDHGTEDFAGIRRYRYGDSARRIVWPRYLNRDELVVKEFTENAGESPVWFDYEDAGPGDPEMRLGRLCRWILDADAADRPWGLTLPDVRIGPGKGGVQRRHALEALARWRSPVRTLDHD